MPGRYHDVYPSRPLLDSEQLDHPSAAALMSVQYFRVAPDVMEEDVFAEHHVLLNLNSIPHRVQNRRDGVLRDFTFEQDQIIGTPAEMRSGWRWFDTSDEIVLRLDPEGGPVCRI